MNDTEPSLRLHTQSFGEYYLSALEGFWFCKYPNSTPSRDITMTAVCLGDAPPVTEPPPTCECPPVEPLQDRIFRSEQTGTSSAGTVKRFAAFCPADATLIAGGCAIPSGTMGEDRFTNLISAGFAKDMDDSDVWECAWSNASTVDQSPSIVAVCLRPPMAGTAPEAEPSADRLVKVEQRNTLPAGTSFIHEVTCADGDFLVHGGCTLEDPESAPSNLNIFRSGFVPEENNRPNTWQCGWNNPSSSTPTAIATALCLKPPSVSP